MEDIWTGGDSFPTRDWNERTRQLPKVWLNLDWGSYIVTVAKTASKKIGALIRSIKFFSPEVALYLYKSTIQPCMKYCYHVWAGAPSCFFELLDKLQKWICRTVGPSFAASLELLAHCQNVSNLSLFNRYYLGRCSSELAQLVPLRYFWRRFTCYSDRLHSFSAIIPRRTCAYQELRNVRFLENSVCFVFLKHPFWDSPFCFISDEVSF